MAPGFVAACLRCNKEQPFEEFFRERRAARSERAARAGEFTAQQEYRFRCTACGVLEEKLLDKHGVLHKWTGNRHVTLKLE